MLADDLAELLVVVSIEIVHFLSYQKEYMGAPCSGCKSRRHGDCSRATIERWITS
ncbi:hypothetical protein OAN59_04235 [Alphaproteobacteria bacterium]|nr:hypothetical protein [Alphaproteobacteria bacterium]